MTARDTMLQSPSAGADAFAGQSLSSDPAGPSPRARPSGISVRRDSDIPRLDELTIEELTPRADRVDALYASASGVTDRTFLAAIKQLTPVVCAVIERPGQLAPMSDKVAAAKRMMDATFRAALGLIERRFGAGAEGWRKTIVMNHLVSVSAAAWRRNLELTDKELEAAMETSMAGMDDGLFAGLSHKEDFSPAATMLDMVLSASARIDQSLIEAEFDPAIRAALVRKLTAECLALAKRVSESTVVGEIAMRGVLGHCVSVLTTQIRKMIVYGDSLQLGSLGTPGAAGDAFRNKVVAALMQRTGAAVSEIVQTATKIVAAQYPEFSIDSEKLNEGHNL